MARYNPFVQSRAADKRFLSGMLKRHGGVREALAEVQRLRDLGPDGQIWWRCMEAHLTILLAEGCAK